jgi:elongation factor Ts
MAITAAMVKELRSRTGAGMMECKGALTETDGDMEAAVELLRKKGAAKADKKSGRLAADGVIVALVSPDKKSGVLVEVNCETDFVAKDENFSVYARAVAATVMAKRPGSMEELSALSLSDGKSTVEEARRELITKIGENINVRRFQVIEVETDANVSAYVHGNRIGVLVTTSGGRADLGKDIAMHVAASRPLYLTKDEIPEEVAEKEREIYTAQAGESGKPENIVEKIVEGKLQKYFNDITLLGQPFVKEPDQNVGKLLKSEKATIEKFIRFEVGEGLERRADDFVAEVMAQAKGA